MPFTQFFEKLSLINATSFYRGGKQRGQYELSRAITLLSLASLRDANNFLIAWTISS
jgi:hypothetical protein